MSSAREPFPTDSFEILAAEEPRHWWFRARNKVILWALKNQVGRFKSFLEVGCGTAFVLEGVKKAYPGAELCGSEYFEEGLVFAKRRLPDVTFKQLDATLMSEESRYDVIGAFDVIEHIDQDQIVLKNLARALKEGGSLMVSVPQHMWLWSHVDEYACHVRRYTRLDLISKIESAGLKVKYTTSFVSFLVPLMWLSRLRKHKGEYDTQKEFHIPGWLNKSLETVMKLELGLIKIGLTLPFGGSLLLVATKP
ncbi:MAG: class I SAM-dependent methyltransferase [Pseudomonas sp.]|uniref:class I SAM-dependent methyltransferase n=1 Tax=Pseudomonas sp. TaxID=306 RepID=UPI003D700987